MRKNRRRSRKERASTFDPQDETLVEHRKLGVWDLYVERGPKLSYFPTSWRVEEYIWLFNDLPYLWRTIRDVGSVAWPLLFLYVAFTLIKSLVPAVNIWYVERIYHFSIGEYGATDSFIGSPGSSSTL
jgi:hypothetical protein